MTIPRPQAIHNMPSAAAPTIAMSSAVSPACRAAATKAVRMVLMGGCEGCTSGWASLPCPRFDGAEALIAADHS